MKKKKREPLKKIKGSGGITRDEGSSRMKKNEGSGGMKRKKSK